MKVLMSSLFCFAAGVMLAAGETLPFQFGAVTHFAQRKGDPAINLEILTGAGMNTLRDEVPWREVEREKGKYVFPDHSCRYLDYAVKMGLTPLIICDYGNPFYDKGGYPVSKEAVQGYVNYCDFLMTATKGKVRLFQLWNEWDGGCGMPGHKPGSLEAYYRLISQAYPVLKAKHPGVFIIANPVCTGDANLEKLLAMGLAKYCDAVAVHPYNYDKENIAHAEEWYARMQRIEAMIRKHHGGQEKPLVVTEMGFPNMRVVSTGSHAGKWGSTLQQSADRLTQILLLAKTMPYFAGYWVYDFQDDGWKLNDQENNFGLIRPDATPKPALAALQSIAPLLTKGKFTGFLLPGEKNLRALSFECEGKQAMVFWCTCADTEVQLVLTHPKPAGKVSVFLAGTPAMQRSWGHRDWVANRAFKTDPRQLRFSVTERPLIVTGDLKGVKVRAAGCRAAQPVHPVRPGQNLKLLQTLALDNFNFHHPAQKGVIPGWEKTLKKAALTTPVENNRRLLHVVEPAPGETTYAGIAKTFPVQAFDRQGKLVIFTFSGRYRMKEVTGRGVTFTLSFYDKNNKRTFRDSGYQNGSTSGWLPFRFSVIMPKGSVTGKAQVNFAPGVTGTFDADSLKLQVEVYE